ncbi:MAG: hypothetical protein CMH55_02735 [Myxococcales bacterium]|nr:hypothetical protein [Myxococcales bacterium]
MWAKLNLVVSALMGLSAALQYNDPDPLPWIAFYGCAALAGFSYTARLGPFFCVAVAAIGAGWAGHLAQAHHQFLDWAHLAQSMQAESPGIELGREIGGLSLASAWLAAIGIGQWMRRREAQRGRDRHQAMTPPRE